MKLEKEQERKKKELQAMADRKKEQHAKRASRHISKCFIFFPAFFLFFTCLFVAFQMCVKAFPFSLSPRSSKTICAASKRSRWKWIR